MRIVSCDGIYDLGALANLRHLTSLDVSMCKNVRDLSPLARLPLLNEVDLRGCEKIPDLTPLRDVINRGAKVQLPDHLAKQLERLRQETDF